MARDDATGQVFETAGEVTYRRMHRDLLFGELAPGQRLRLDALRERYDTSVSTLREVMNRLASDGLILIEPQRGFEVAPVSLADLREIAEMRQLLECAALRLSFAQGDLEWEARVVGAHHKLSKLETAMLAGDRSQTALWKHYDREFHVTLISACGSAELLAMHQRIFDRFLRYQVLLLLFRGEEAVAEHQQLLAAALSRDADRAEAVLARHVSACIEHTATNVLS